jgi:hypothetical protein
MYRETVHDAAPTGSRNGTKASVYEWRDVGIEVKHGITAS